MHNCAYCQELSASTQQCSGCKSVFYHCDKGCQASDWPNHKPICKMLASKPGATICQLSAVLHPSFKISQIDRFRKLLDEKLFIVDGKARTDFGRMWEDIRYRHPSLKGGIPFLYLWNWKTTEVFWAETGSRVALGRRQNGRLQYWSRRFQGIIDFFAQLWNCRWKWSNVSMVSSCERSRRLDRRMELLWRHYYNFV